MLSLLPWPLLYGIGISHKHGATTVDLSQCSRTPITLHPKSSNITTKCISPCRPSLAAPSVWPQPRTALAESPAIDVELLQQRAGVSKSIFGLWSTERDLWVKTEEDDEDLFAGSDDDDDCAEELSESDCSCPPSPLFHWDKPLALARSPSFSFADEDEDEEEDFAPVASCMVSRVLFPDDELNAVDHQPSSISVKLPPTSHTYAELYPGEASDDDESYFAELPSFDHAPAQSPPDEDEDFLSTSTSFFNDEDDWLEIADRFRPPSPKLSLFQRNSSTDHLLCVDEETDEDLWLEDDGSSLESDEDYEDAPSFPSSPPSCSRPSLATVDEEEEEEYIEVRMDGIEGFVDLQALRKPFSRRPRQGAMDLRDELRREVMVQSACRVAQPVA